MKITFFSPTSSDHSHVPSQNVPSQNVPAGGCCGITGRDVSSMGGSIIGGSDVSKLNVLFGGGNIANSSSIKMTSESSGGAPDDEDKDKKEKRKKKSTKDDDDDDDDCDKDDDEDEDCDDEEDDCSSSYDYEDDEECDGNISRLDLEVLQRNIERHGTSQSFLRGNYAVGGDDSDMDYRIGGKLYNSDKSNHEDTTRYTRDNLKDRKRW